MNNMNMNMNMFLIILIIFILAYNKLERFFIETATYLGKVVIREDVKCEKNVDVNGDVNAKRLCIDNTCINKSKMQFIKQLPLKLKTAVCIGNTCVDENSFMVIKTLTEIKNNSVVNFKVVSSGAVLEQFTGVAEFYVNNNLNTDISVGRGFNIMVINEDGTYNDFRVFDTNSQPNDRQFMIDYIKNIDYGLFVMVAVYDDVEAYDRPSVTLYEYGAEYGKNYKFKLNADGSDTYITAGDNTFINDSISQIFVGDDIKATLYEHNVDNGAQDSYYSGISDVKSPDTASMLKISKKYMNNIVTVYEALKLVGSIGNIAPNYRGSYALIGRRGMNPGDATEEVKNSSAGHKTPHQVTIDKTIKSGDLYVKLTE